MGTHVVQYECDDFGADVTLMDDGRFQLCWHDFVANTWVETYNCQDDAIARLALLIVANREGRFFSNEPTSFSLCWNEFVTAQLQTVKKEPGYQRGAGLSTEASV